MNFSLSKISFLSNNFFPEILKKELSSSPLPETSEKTKMSFSSGSVALKLATMLPLGSLSLIRSLLKIIFVGGSRVSCPNN